MDQGEDNFTEVIKGSASLDVRSLGSVGASSFVEENENSSCLLSNGRLAGK